MHWCVLCVPISVMWNYHFYIIVVHCICPGRWKLEIQIIKVGVSPLVYITCHSMLPLYVQLFIYHTD